MNTDDAANPSQWASIYIHTAEIGAFHFYKEQQG
jgi:hypothetical protein